MTSTFLGEKISAPVQFISNQPGFISETITLKSQYLAYNTQRWELSFEVLPENPANFFRRMVSSTFSNITMEMPQIHDGNQLDHTFDGTATISGNEGVNSAVISFTVPSGNNGLRIQPNTFIKFSNHDKVYLVTDSTVIASNAGTIDIFPTLRVALTSSHTIKYKPSEVIFTGRRTLDTLNGISFQDGILTSPGSITLQEVV